MSCVKNNIKCKVYWPQSLEGGEASSGFAEPRLQPSPERSLGMLIWAKNLL